MKKFILPILIVIGFDSFSQIKNISTYANLIKVQNNLKLPSESVVVWGYFGAWGKFGWDSYKSICPGKLNKSDYSGLLSGVELKLFSDSIFTYVPIKNSAKLLTDFTYGDIIKLKIKLYKNCKTFDNKIFFLIEEML